MRGPTAALLWEIWQRHRRTVAAIAGLTVAGLLVDRFQRGDGVEASPLTNLLGMLAFLLLFSVFNYTDSSGARGVGSFPRRLFTLPVSSLRLVAVPMLAALASIELLYLLWIDPLSRGGTTSGLFVAVLLAVLMVLYLATLWMLERAGSLRLLVFGVIASAVFTMGLLPTFPPAPPPRWRSELMLAGVSGCGALAVFVLAWQHVARVRVGGARTAGHWQSLIGSIGVRPARRRPFRSAAAAHFWLEWRSSGMVLPALVAGVVLMILLPMSWLVRSDAAGTFRLLLAALAAPVVLAVPVGVAFSKPAFWSEDLAVPAFVAVRPLSSEDLVAIKMKVAAASAGLSWTAVMVFLAMWLPSWANLDSLSRLAIQLWAFHGQSIAAVYGIAVLVLVSGMLLTWRFLVSRLWAGLSGMRPMFVGSVAATVIFVIAGIAFDAGRLPGWLLGDPARLVPVVRIAAVAVAAKYWLAAYAWRRVASRYLLIYLPIWLAGTASLLALGLVVWGIVRIYLPGDVDRLRSVVILFALLAIPLARVGLAPCWLARNRHRS